MNKIAIRHLLSRWRRPAPAAPPPAPTAASDMVTLHYGRYDFCPLFLCPFKDRSGQTVERHSHEFHRRSSEALRKLGPTAPESPAHRPTSTEEK